MSFEFKLPILGEKIESGTIVAIKVKAGDMVQKEQTILELETDKAVIEIPVSQAGTVKEVKVKVGEKAKVGQVMLVLEEGIKEEPRNLQVTQQESPVIPPSSKTVPVPVSLPAPEQKVEMKSAVLNSNGVSEIMAGPSVRAMAREMGVDLARVTGSGPGGRITNEDVKNFVNESLSNQAHGAAEGEAQIWLGQSEGATQTPLITMPDFSKWGSIEVKPMSGVRRATAKSMSQSWSNIPMVTQFESADITEILELRKKYVKRVEAAGGKLTVTAIIMKVAGAALKVFPQLNASVDMAHESIVLKKYIHIGVAVDTERGLLVPVIRNVDQRNIVELSVDLHVLAEKSRQKKISLEELDGATFTITNLGSIGTTYFTPIVNWPQVAILGIGRSEVKPVWQDNTWVPRTILPLSVTYDHRAIDGADAGRFLKWMSEALQDPFLIELQG